MDGKEMLIKPKIACPGANASVLFIAIMSAVEHQPERQAIRQTWLRDVGGVSLRRESNVSSVAIFFFGLPESKEANDILRQEASVYGDIVQYNFKDTYRNLTIKTMLIFDHIIKTCPQAGVIVKTDDDTWLNIPRLVSRFDSIRKNSTAIFGCIIAHSKPIRDPEHRWYISYEEYPQDTFLDYVNGPGYVLSMSAAKKAFDVCTDTALMPFEDLYFTGMCASKAGVRVYRDVDFYPWRWNNSACFHHRMVHVNPINAHEMLDMWPRMLRVRNKLHSC